MRKLITGLAVLIAMSVSGSATFAANGSAAAPGSSPTLCQRLPLSSPPSHLYTLTPLRQAVLTLARHLARRDLAIEQAALLYRRPDGSVRTGAVTEGDGQSVSMTVDSLPGEAVVAAFHTHPRYPYYTVDQSRLSEEDIELGTQLLTLAQTDRRLLLYVLDISTATLSEYAATGVCPREGSH